MLRSLRLFVALVAMLLALPTAARASAPAPSPAATAQAADAFVADAEKQLLAAYQPTMQSSWVNLTYLTDDTDALAAAADARFTALQVRLAGEAAKYRAIPGVSADTRRKLELLVASITLPAPTRPGGTDEMAALVIRMSSAYGKGHGTLDGKPINGSDIEAAMGAVRDPARSKKMWVSWNDQVGAPMRADFIRSVAIENEGARELGFADTGALWRSGYDMPPEQFAALTDRVWQQVEPLYKALHAYVRWKLNAKYGDAVQPKTGPIRADLLGNMWAQEWGNIYDVVAPAGAGDLGYDIGDLLKAKGYDPVRMFRTGKGFYSSLGFAPLPASFWTRSMIVKPADREVVCHASAWDIDAKDDLRIKMCTKVNADDFVTIHHEMGHLYYGRAYNTQPYLYRDSAHDGFHEAIGDFIALSITPDYLVKIGLLDPAKVPAADKDRSAAAPGDGQGGVPAVRSADRSLSLGHLFGAIPPGELQAGWDRLRLRYQGIAAPAPRDETKFDAGAKYHVAAGVPYTRYFLARLLQFQFYAAACRQAGWKGPLHRCSFFGDKAVGAKFDAMLAMGRSKPWPDALAAFTGSREMSGAPMVAYFAPLKAWLDRQNQGKPVGW